MVTKIIAPKPASRMSPEDVAKAFGATKIYKRTNMMLDTRSTIEPTDVDKINASDLKRQDEGEMHILHKDRMVRLKSFISGSWESREQYEEWREQEGAIARAQRSADESKNNRSIKARLKSIFSRCF